jgi:feruloyl esterase
MITRFTGLMGLACLGTLSACKGSGDGSAAPPAAPLQALSSCNQVTSAVSSLDVGAGIKLRIVSVETVADAGSVPAHCHVIGAINERTGHVDNKPYAIKFRLRMPVNWNGRFFMEGGGGSNGVLGTSATSANYGNIWGGQTTTALSMGYSVIATDSGHDNTVDSDPNASGGSAFGMDNDARIDFGYRSYDLVTKVGKAIVTRYYAKAPDKSYFVGCSEGGREAALMAERFPDSYDGIVVGDPGISLPYSASYAPYLIQTFGPLAVAQGKVDATGTPLLNKTFTDGDLQLVATGVLAACDRLDGLQDGISNNVKACTDAVVMPELRKLQCTGAKDASCLTAGQIDAMHAAMRGPKTSWGKQLYSATPWDPGIGGMNGGTFNGGFRSWWLGSYAAATNNAIKIRLSTPQHAMVWRTPPVPLTADKYVNFEANFNIDATEDLISATTSIYTESAKSFGMANSVDLKAFASRGGKMLMFHGMADSSFSAYDTMDWYDGINRDQGGRAAAFAKLFLIPGMNHCSGGPATDLFDIFTPLVRWVEQGVAPATIRASASNPGYFGVASRTRPLCPYPTYAAYKGSGDINSADSFVCTAP